MLHIEQPKKKFKPLEPNRAQKRREEKFLRGKDALRRKGKIAMNLRKGKDEKAAALRLRQEKTHERAVARREALKKK